MIIFSIPLSGGQTLQFYNTVEGQMTLVTKMHIAKVSLFAETGYVGTGWWGWAAHQDGQMRREPNREAEALSQTSQLSRASTSAGWPSPLLTAMHTDEYWLTLSPGPQVLTVVQHH